jgi:hypothetical protein
VNGTGRKRTEGDRKGERVGSEATRKSDDLPEEQQPQGVRKPDPWGVKRAENLLTSLQGVLSARVVVSSVGEVTEVHVLTNAATPAKQMVRNVESALLAHLGLKVDHRRISVAQTAEVRPIEALEQDAVEEAARRRPVVFRSLEVRASGHQRVTIAATLGVHGADDVVGEEEVADTHRARVRGAARAAARALDKIFATGTLELEGVKELEGFDSSFMTVAVHLIEGRDTHLLIGTALIRESAERSAALALLDATNRWIASRR